MSMISVQKRKDSTSSLQMNTLRHTGIHLSTFTCHFPAQKLWICLQKISMFSQIFFQGLLYSHQLLFKLLTSDRNFPPYLDSLLFSWTSHPSILAFIHQSPRYCSECLRYVCVCVGWVGAEGVVPRWGGNETTPTYVGLILYQEKTDKRNHNT